MSIRIQQHQLASFLKFLIVVGILFIVFMLFRLQAQNRQLAEQAAVINQQTQNIAIQATNIAERNNAIATENTRHIDCIADLFARHTRDNLPITIKDLDTCQVERAGANATSQNSSSEPDASQDQNPNDNTNQSNSETSNSNTQTSQAPRTNPPRRILGVPVCVPFTDVCARENVVE